MADLLLDRIHSQIRARVRELEPLAREHDRLEAALTALGGPVAGRAATSAPAAKAATAKRGSKVPTTARRASAKRAPRGANRAAVLGVLAERPGVSASELAGASGVARPVLYALLRTLDERGEIAKEELPGGTTGYRLAPESPSALDASSAENAGA
jgi:IclR-like helix-turn-helix domain-containing protein